MKRGRYDPPLLNPLPPGERELPGPGTDRIKKVFSLPPLAGEGRGGGAYRLPSLPMNSNQVSNFLIRRWRVMEEKKVRLTAMATAAG